VSNQFPPNPQFAKDLQEWANQLVEFIQDRGQVIPQAVLLEHQTDSAIYKATTEGNPMGMSAEHDSMSCSGMSAQAAEAFVDMLCKTVQWQHAAITIKGTT